MVCLTLAEVCKAVCGILILGDENTQICDITTDSRKVKAGDLFIPLIGENFDGHSFIDSVFSSGAVACLTSKNIPGYKDNTNDRAIIKVDDTKKALCDLARYYRSKFDLKVTAITGSVGKTTTKDFIANVLEQGFSVLKTEGNYNNEIGLPLTIFRLEKEHNAAVFEMGMSGFGEIDHLSYIAKPDVAVITNIGISHIQNLGSKEGILKAKLEIVNFLKDDGLVIINADDDSLADAKSVFKHKYKSVGIKSKNSDLTASCIYFYDEKKKLD